MIFDVPSLTETPVGLSISPRPLGAYMWAKSMAAFGDRCGAMRFDDSVGGSAFEGCAEVAGGWMIYLAS
jgi:hypothetical protein